MSEKKERFVLSLIRKGLLCLIMMALVLFISAGSTVYLEAWVFLATFALLAFSLCTWLYCFHPEQFLNRFRKETNQTLQRITTLMGGAACAALLLAGLDKRFGWSHSTNLRFIFAALLCTCAILIYRNVFVQNPFLSNAVEIQEGHRVVCEGMYRYVRHPMYLATACICAVGLIILGSWVTFPIYVIFVGLIALRIRYEEKQLQEALPDYAVYSKKVRYRLIPYIW